MKKLFVFIAASFAALSLSAQGNPMMQALPNDPAVRVGKLENGLTYYIRHNELPKNRAEFYLATNTGGIYETPDQDGLAHFLEHMCFNGTERFPGKGILNYLQSIGAEFGRNINASTGFEETQYMLNNMPVERPTVADTCLLILSEYAHYVTNSTEEIDLERPVIIGEKRQRNTAQWRTLEKSLPYYFGDTKYATCTLIGSQESLETFAPQSLHNFYAAWYHPDRQAVIVVGDIDPDRIEAKIKEYFGRIPKCENPQAKPEIPFPANKEPVVGILTDPETTNATIEMAWKSEAQPEEMNATIIGQLNDLVKSLVNRIMTERFTDITSKPGAAFLDGSLYIGDLIYESIDAVDGEVTLREDNILEGFRAFYTELERMKRYGFTAEEYNRAKAEIISWEEAAVERAATRKNPEFIRELLNHFFDQKSYLEPAMEKQIVEALLGQIGVDQLNQIVPQLITDENLVVIYSGPEKEGYPTPTKEQILQIIEEVKASDIAAPQGEEVAAELLNAAALKAGKVKSTAPAQYGATKWTLSNGIEVYLLPTEYRKDQILFNLWREGGQTLIATEDLPSFDSNVISMFQQNSGVAGFSGTQLKKMLTGKNVNMMPYVSSITHGISGSSTKKDLQTAFELMYLLYTNPRFDADEYQVGIDQLRAMLPGLAENPQYKLQKKLFEVLYGGNPRNTMLSEEVLDKASIATFEKVYKQLFNGTKGLKLQITGDFNPDEIKPLVEKYVGSIKKGGKATAWADNTPDFVNGIVSCIDPVKMETPQSTAVLLYHAPLAYTQTNKAALDAISYILDMRYTASLREDIGGTYGASAPTQLMDLPKEKGFLQVIFQCDPEKREILVKTAEEQFADLATAGPTKEEFDMTVLNLKKNVPEKRLNNSYWQNLIKSYIMNPVEVDKAYEDAVNNLTADDIKKAAAELLNSGNFMEFVQIPE